MSARLFAYLRAHHVALLALFVALGGSSYAAIKLPKNSVGSRQITSGAVTAVKLHTNAVTSIKVKDHSLLAKDFKAGELPAGPSGVKGDTGPQGPPGPSTGPAGGDLTGSYPNPVIAPGAVTSAKFATGAQAPNAAQLGGLPASDYGAVLSGRMNNMNNIVPDYGAASGTSTVSTTESAVSTLSPDRNLVARDLSVQVTVAPDPVQRVFTLVVNGATTDLSCTVGGPATTCQASGPVSVPADSTLSLEDEVPGVAVPTADARFAFRLTPS
jgi:hypothetical protein